MAEPTSDIIQRAEQGHAVNLSKYIEVNPYRDALQAELSRPEKLERIQQELKAATAPFTQKVTDTLAYLVNYKQKTIEDDNDSYSWRTKDTQQESLTTLYYKKDVNANGVYRTPTSITHQFDRYEEDPGITIKLTDGIPSNFILDWTVSKPLPRDRQSSELAHLIQQAEDPNQHLLSFLQRKSFFNRKDRENRLGNSLCFSISNVPDMFFQSYNNLGYSKLVYPFRPTTR